MNSNIIRFENVVKEYRDGASQLRVLDEVSFTVKEGEFVVIGGPSGAGKSTILNLAGGMDPLTSGRIIIDGEDISSYSPSELTKFRAETIGFIFQFYNLIPNLNAVENVIFGSEVKEGTFDPYEILEKVGMTDRAKAFPPTMSGGEQQRIAIARAIAKNPKVLLCDEPTGALDYVTGKQVLEIIEDLNREMGMTVVLVTHNGVLRAMGDRYISIHDGRISEIQVNEARTPVRELEW